MPHRTISTVIGDRKLIAMPTATTVSQIAELMRLHHISAVLVAEGPRQRLQGICTERDIVLREVAMGLDPERVRVDEIMTANPRTISPDKPFGHALHLMYEGGFRHLPVVEDDCPVGIVCAKDSLELDARTFQDELVQREEIMAIL